jgi:hypothetical protein
MLINDLPKIDRRPKIPRGGKGLGFGAAIAALAIVFFAYQTQTVEPDGIDTSSVVWQPATNFPCDSVEALSGDLAVGADLVCLRVNIPDQAARLVVMASDVTGIVLVIDGDTVGVATSPVVPAIEGLATASVGLLETTTVAVRLSDGTIKLFPLVQ